MKPHLNIKIDVALYERYVDARAYIEQVWQRAKTPLKFPQRRRRQDREIPKAA